MAVTKENTASTAKEVKEREAEMKKPANIAPATEFAPSGAPVQTTEVDVNHPAVDNNPRADTTVAQNKADFNDPGLSMEESVRQNLIAGGSGAVAGEPDSEEEKKASAKKD